LGRSPEKGAMGAGGFLFFKKRNVYIGSALAFIWPGHIF